VAPIITLTPRAYEKVVEALVCDGFTPFGAEAHLRVGVLGGGCSGFTYALDLKPGNPERAEKCIIWMQGDIMIAVDYVSAQYLKGTVVDFKQSGLQSGFAFENPNAKGTCGCGSSFTT
jgi:iron-sulfur cluster assembly protein